MSAPTRGYLQWLTAALQHWCLVSAVCDVSTVGLHTPLQSTHPAHYRSGGAGLHTLVSSMGEYSSKKSLLYQARIFGNSYFTNGQNW